MSAERQVARVRAVPGARARALAGGALWIVAVLWARPHPFDLAWGQALLAFAPLALLPLGLRLASSSRSAGAPGRPERAVEALQLPAASLFGAAYLFPQGPLAAALALPWLATTALVALCGLQRIRRFGLQSPGDACIDAGSIYLAVGGAWALSDRLGFRPLGFDPVVVLLTAIHFHYAGFILPVVTGLAARELPGRTAALAVAGVVAAVPFVAVGITATQLGWGTLAESSAAWLMASGGMLSAWLHVRLACRRDQPPLVRGLWAASALFLAGSMALAALYGSRFYAPVSWLSIPWMRALHGTANALGFGLASVVAWTLARSDSNESAAAGSAASDR